MILTHSSMLDLWRLIRGFEPLRADGVITRSDGIDLDRLLTLEMEAWYDNLLLTAPPEMLCPYDISTSAVFTINPDRSVTIPLPPDTLRVTHVMLDCWKHPARVLIPGRDDAEIKLQASPFSAAGAANPVAIHAGTELRLYSIPQEVDTPLITSLCIIRRPTDGTFALQPAALHNLLENVR